MRRLAVAVLMLGPGCVFAPQLDQHGYIECTHDDQCTPSGRICASGYCSPPTWWNPQYHARRQITVTNDAAMELPVGFPLRIPVGPEPRPLLPSEMSPTSRLVMFDRTLRTQVELPVTVDVIDSISFDAVFKLPVALAAAQGLADLWIYYDASGVDTRVDARSDVYPLDDSFEAEELDQTLWNLEGNASAPPGDGEVNVVRGGYFWSTLAISANPGVVLTAVIEVTPANSCEGLTIGLIDNNVSGYATPYVAIEAHRDSTSEPSYLVVQAARSDTALIEPDMPQRFAIKNTSMRIDLSVSGTKVVAMMDGVVVESFAMREPITRPLRAHFFVEGGTCTLSVKQARMRATVSPEPAIVVGPKVDRP